MKGVFEYYLEHPVSLLMGYSLPVTENLFVSGPVSNQYFPGFHAVQLCNFFYFPASPIGKPGDDITIIKFYLVKKFKNTHIIPPCNILTLNRSKNNIYCRN